MFIGLAFLLMLFTRYVTTITEDWTDCPTACQCKWISGKKSAICREAGFSVIPSALNAEMQVLDISGNSVPHLQKEGFKNAGLIHLQRIFLKNAGVFEIDKDAFKELKILVEIDLSDNFVSLLHQDTFSGNDRLRTIYMNGNPLSELKNSQFPELPHLKSLEFQRCQIKYIQKYAFLHLSALESLSLNGNKLNYLSEAVFLPLPKLKTLVLDGNPWKCDCQLRNFRNWLLPLKLYSRSLICTRPTTFKGKLWQEVNPVDFACAPNVSSIDKVIQGVLGGNVSLKCNVYGDPEPNVSWLFNSYTLDNNTLIQDSSFYVEEKYASNMKSEKWSVMVLYNVSDTSAGEYTCKATNARGESSTNINLILLKEAIATTMKKDESWLLSIAFIVASALSISFALMITCICQRKRRTISKPSRRSKLKRRTTFSDQDKKLLDVSVSTTDKRTGSFDGFGSQPEIEMIRQSTQSVPLELRDQPVHITIEGRAADSSVSIFPPASEFSSCVLPRSAFGNIFISVSVDQEPSSRVDRARYPDLIDIAKRNGEKVDFGYFETLPTGRHRLKESEIMAKGQIRSQYDNMGPRITADGSSTISLPESISIEEIPTPPPPPSCSPMTVDYISL